MEHLAEIGVLIAWSWPAVRAAASPSFRRVFPYDAARIGAVAVVYLTAVAALAVYAPGWLRWPAVVAAVSGAYLLWRSRPRYGVEAGLPPGSLAPLPVRPWSDPGFFAKQVDRYGNVFKMCQFGRPMVCIVGLERANRLLLAHDEALFPPPLPFSRFIEGGYLRYLPEETHIQYRRLFSDLFDPEVIARAEPRIAATFRDGLGGMASRCGTGGTSHGVRVEPSMLRMMFIAWTQLFYGIDAHHPDFPRLLELCKIIDIRKARWARRRRVEGALEEIESILRRQVASFGADDREAPACFLAALVELRPDALGDRTVVGNLIYIMLVSWGDVAGLLIWVWKMLSDHPEWRDRLAAELGATDAAAPQRAGDLATRIAQETLRFEQSEHRYRRAAEDLEIDGFRIPAGWLIRICVRESHQDPEVFAQPDRFDPDRFSGRTFTRAEYAPFGVFRLACIGQQLTMTIARIFATQLVSGFDWRVTQDGPPEISNFAHNAPSPRWRVHVSPKAPNP
jgi:cytochrome P450